MLRLVFDESNGFFWLFPFILNLHSVDVIEKPGKAYETAKGIKFKKCFY
jgi:hypothetical protein